MDIKRVNTKLKAIYNCSECNINLKDENSLEKHIRLHSFTEKCLTKAEMALRRKLLYQEVKNQRNIFSEQVSSAPKNNKRRKIYRRISKKIGLTKIKMEDCLRCDACSCIYIDPADYFKHMKNFHEKYNTLIPGIRRKENYKFEKRKNGETLNDKVSAGVLEKQPSKKPAIVEPRTSLVSSQHICEKIKNRWSEMISRRLSLPPIDTIKCEPLDDEEYDINNLVSNVEVNIKIEPREMQFKEDA